MVYQGTYMRIEKFIEFKIAFTKQLILLYQTLLIVPSLVLVFAKRTYSLNQSVNYAFGREHVLRRPVLRDHHDSLIYHVGRVNYV